MIRLPEGWRVTTEGALRFYCRDFDVPPATEARVWRNMKTSKIGCGPWYTTMTLTVDGGNGATHWLHYIRATLTEAIATTEGLVPIFRAGHRMCSEKCHVTMPLLDGDYYQVSAPVAVIFAWTGVYSNEIQNHEAIFCEASQEKLPVGGGKPMKMWRQPPPRHYRKPRVAMPEHLKLREWDE